MSYLSEMCMDGYEKGVKSRLGAETRLRSQLRWDRSVRPADRAHGSSICSRSPNNVDCDILVGKDLHPSSIANRSR